MSLADLAKEYQATAVALKLRIKELKRRQEQGLDEGTGALSWRIRTLEAMYRETQSVGALCEHYYERGYYRNGRYSL